MKKEMIYPVLLKELKECYVCHWALPLSEFHKNCRTKDGLVGICKLCAKERRQEWYKKNRQRLIEYSAEYQKTHREEYNIYHRNWGKKNKERNATTMKRFHKNHPLKRRIKTLSNYGLSLDEYDLLMEQQNGRCAICGIPQAEVTRKFFVDHNHDTGKNRGLLCIKCNSGIGNLNDNIQIVKSAMEYLEKHQGNTWR